MRMVRLPDQQWVRADHVVLIEPVIGIKKGDNGEQIGVSALRVAVETARSIQDFHFNFDDTAKAFKVADELAAEVMKDDCPIGGGIHYAGQPFPSVPSGGWQQ